MATSGGPKARPPSVGAGGYCINAAQAGEPPSRWWGPGPQAPDLIPGQIVQRKPYKAIYQQSDPRTGANLGRPSGCYPTPAYQAETDRAAAVRAWADKINAQPDAPLTMRDLAASMGPQADQTAARAKARYAEPGNAYVARLRAQHETHIQVSGPPGSWHYRYPAHLTGPGAAVHLPPPQPGIPAPEPEAGA